MPKRSRQPGVDDGIPAQNASKAVKDVMSSAGTPKKKSSKRSSPTKPKGSSQAQAEQPKSVRSKIVVGVDYGTTFSGVAFCKTLDCDARDIQVITDWTVTSRGKDLFEKVPSRYALAEENDDIDSDRWGYEVESGLKSYMWTKLLLDGSARLTEYDNTHMSSKLQRGLLELPPNMSAQELVTKFLRCLYEHIMKRVAKSVGEDIFEVTPCEFWFTHPATWQDSATDATLQAALDAGFKSREGDTISMITEPEAAAMAILSTAINTNPDLYEVGTNVIIADMGGGTLDFQCLTIQKQSPLQTDETVVGEGGKSGSTFIDCNFHEWMVETFDEAFTELPAFKTGTGSDFMTQWESVKKAFNGEDMKKMRRIPFPALGKALQDLGRAPTSYDFDEWEVLVSGADIARMFEPVLDTAFALLKKQQNQLKKIRAAPFKVICLCGGLGSSEYVWNEFARFCAEEYRGAVQLVTEDRAWSAIARGAAVRGLNGAIVLSKKAKRWYGIGVHRKFVKGVDREEDSWQCPVKGKRANGYIDWTVKKGKKFTANFREVSNVYVPVDPTDDDDDLEFTCELYSCALDDAPSRSDHEAIEHEGKIEFDIFRTVKRQRTQYGPSSSPEAAPIKIGLKLGTEKGVLVVEALHNRTVVGTAKIEYSGTSARRVPRTAGLM